MNDREWQAEIDRRDDIINSYKTHFAWDQAEITRLTKERDDALKEVTALKKIVEDYEQNRSLCRAATVKPHSVHEWRYMQEAPGD